MILCLLMVLWSVGYRQLRFKLVGRIARFAAATPMLAGMLRRLTAFAPGYLIDGFSVAVGIGLIHLLFSMAAGAQAAQLAIAGAVCASLADVAGTVRRNAQQVAAAGAMATLAALVVALANPWPVGLGFGIAAVAFIAMMMLAWGPRAGPASFAAVLSLVFAMAVPAGPPVHALAGWPALGALAFLGWSVLASACLQPRYRALALADALQAMARLLRSRAALLEDCASTAEGNGRLRTWIGDEVALAERLQAARDLLFAAPQAPAARRHNAMLLRTIELRDVLLASRLDLDLVGDDDAGCLLRQRLAGGLRQVAQALDGAESALRRGRVPSQAALDVQQCFNDVALPPGDVRRRLLPLLGQRLQRLADDAAGIHALLRGAEEPLPLAVHELQLFVAPETWPLSALGRQFSVRSPVLRHAVRTALALGCAYALGRVLPWASHPHWLVLNVAVVLRGSLEQTLARRNARVAGTMIGCLVVLALARVPPAQPLAFLVAVGIAHAFINVRYLVTASAATVMALLQSYMLDPSGGFAIVERLADTLIGAALAWGFSYVLPSWERRSLPRAVARALQALREYGEQALQPLQPGKAAGVAQRLARLQAYDALGSLAAALQRSAPEPGRVRLPLQELAQLLDHAHRLMAHLSVVRMMLSQRAAALPAGPVAAALQEAQTALQSKLAIAGSMDLALPGGELRASPPSGTDLQALPQSLPAEDPLPWLLRRLQVAAHDAHRVGHAARLLLAQVRQRQAMPRSENAGP